MSELPNALVPTNIFELHGPLHLRHDEDEAVTRPLERRPSLRIDSLAVDGFGAVSGLTVHGFGDGVTVLLGPNEAGKSTIFDFLTAVLFGFPTRKSDDRYRAPVNGGPHGGSVSLVDAHGSRFVVERHAGAQKRLRVTRPDGTTGDENDLRQLLGGANAELFRAVFAVDLEDLQRLDGMSSDEVREVLFSSSMLGRRRSAARAMKELEQRRDLLVRPRQGGAANAVWDELRKVRAELVRAKASAHNFGPSASHVAALYSHVEQLRENELQARAELGDMDALCRCWETYAVRRQAEQKLSQLSPLSEQERETLAAEPHVAALAAQLSGHRARLSRYGELRGQHKAIVQSIEDKTGALGDWAAAVATADSFDPDSVAEGLQELIERHQEARAVLDTARALRAQAREESAQLRDDRLPTAATAARLGELPGSVELAERLRLLKELRRWAMQLEQLRRDLERESELEAVRAASSQPERTNEASSVVARLRVAAVMAALVLAGLAAVLFADRQVPLGSALVVAAIAFAALAIWVSRTVPPIGSRPADENGPLRPAIDPDSDEGPPLAAQARQRLLSERLGELAKARERVAFLAGETGLGESGCHPIEVDSAIDETESELDARRQLEAEAAALERATSRIAAAEETERASASAATRALAAIHAFARDNGLPAEGEPSWLVEAVARLADLREKTKALARVETELSSMLEEIECFERELVELARRLGSDPQLPGSPGDAAARELAIGRTVEELTAAVEHLKQRTVERQKLEEDVLRADDEISRVFGEGDHAEELRSELITGRPLEWQEARESIAIRLKTLQGAYEQAVREHEGASRALGELAESADVARLEQRCEELEDELHTLMKEYLAVSGSRLLLQRTLKRYEQERQPVVLERAAQHFARVTDGRYVRLAVDSSPDGTKPTVRALGEDGTPLEAVGLSRGTMEQLYLCIRLGLAESFADSYTPLPIVLDDVLVNFDPGRQEAVVRELGEVARRHQVLLLTCHPQIAELVTQIVGDGARTVELDRI